MQDIISWVQLHYTYWDFFPIFSSLCEQKRIFGKLKNYMGRQLVSEFSTFSKYIPKVINKSLLWKQESYR